MLGMLIERLCIMLGLLASWLGGCMRLCDLYVYFLFYVMDGLLFVCLFFIIYY